MASAGDAPEDRRALCVFEAETLGEVCTRGDGEAMVDDDGVSVGGLRVEFLDADGFADQGRVLSLSLFPEGTLRISQLARRHDTFSRALAEARDAARIRGLLAHGLGVPIRFDGALLEPGPERPSRLFVYPTHVTVAPLGADPFQVPLGSVTHISFEAGAYSVSLATAAGTTRLGQLARQTEAFAREVQGAHSAMLERCAKASRTPLFADGRAVSAERLGAHFERLLFAWSAPERLAGAREIVELSGFENAAIGLAELLDMDDDALAPAEELQPNTAAFLLAAIGDLTVFELLSGPSAATYVFRAPLGEVSSDLAALHFRRRGLSLTETEAAGVAGRPYRLALRRLEPLRRLRTRTVARLIHTNGWNDSLRRYLG